MFWRSVFQFIAAPTTKNMENSPGSQRVKNHCSILYTILPSLSLSFAKREIETEDWSRERHGSLARPVGHADLSRCSRAALPIPGKFTRVIAP